MTTTLERNCEICGVAFKAPIRAVNQGFGKCCSRKCGVVATSLKNKKENQPNTTCAKCLTPIYRQEARRRKTKSGLHFCSQECKYASQRIGGIPGVMPSHYGTSIYRTITKGDLIMDKGFQRANANIRNNSLRQYNQSSLPKYCVYCGYDTHYEVCHIRPVSDFPPEALVSDINAMTNLVALCPNHHWELDNGKLQWFDIVEKMTNEE